jgi:hypothetical protein
MPFVHSVFTFRRPAQTVELNEIMHRLEFFPGMGASGQAVGENYLDQFAVGVEVSVSMTSPTGKAAKVHSKLFLGTLETAGETATVSSAVLLDQEQTTWENPAVNPMFAAKLAAVAKRINNYPVVFADEATTADGALVYTTPQQPSGPKP